VRLLSTGYEGAYSWHAERIYDDGDTLSPEECTEVVDILDMYSGMQRAFDVLKDKSGIEKDLTFPGFDGNNETSQMTFADYFCRQGRFTDLKRGKDWNSHFPSIDAYRRMLEVWRPLRKKLLERPTPLLTREEIIEILNARIHPSNRK
jgi:uncharacterized protein YfbU (UPF0304 family)